ncbi:MAG: endonuclease/exonuclease/phosphatase family protein [Agitococcus sp.]|nr:endonuclease/exonuclease/phosphatase family protein [Agitococcus sp.]
MLPISRFFSIQPAPRVTPYRILILLCPLMATAAALLAPFGIGLPWALDLMTHWVWPGLLYSLLFSLVGSWKERLLSIGSAAVCLILVASAIPSSDSLLKEGVTLKLASINVLSSNTDYAAFDHWLASSQPDVVSVLEVSRGWEQALNKQTRYPFKHIIAGDDNFGIALLSRYPFVVVPPDTRKGPVEPTSISVVVSAPSAAPFQVTAVHPPPPLTPTLASLHASQLAYLGGKTARYQGAAFLLGDFNATPWSSASWMLSQLGLTRMSGTHPTWPAKWLPVELLPLDVIVSNRHAKLISVKVGTAIGSDHRPIEATVLVPLAAH